METALTKPAPMGMGRAAAAAGIAAEDFERLVREHQRRIYRVLLAVLRDAEAADTLTQECFLRAYQKRGSFRGESSVQTWLVSIALNLARDHAKNRRQSFWRRFFYSGQDERVAAEMHRVADPGGSPERIAAAREDARTVWSAVEQLSPQQRAVFALRFAEEMTFEEIAAATGLETGTVKSHLHRAVSAVRKRLAAAGKRDRG